MPTSSQSKILSVVDYQLLQQQQASGQDGTTKSSDGLTVSQTAVSELRRRHSKDNRRPSLGKKDDDNQSPPPPNLTARRRSSGKINDGNISFSDYRGRDYFRNNSKTERVIKLLFFHQSKDETWGRRFLQYCIRRNQLFSLKHRKNYL